MSAPVTILTDVDQVLLDWVGPFDAWATARGWTEVERLIDVYAPSRAYGMGLDEELALIAEFNAGLGPGDQPPLPCAAVAVPLLRAAGHRFVAVTACGPEAARIRPGELAGAFGFAWDRVEVVPLRASKADVLRRLREELGPCAWVEDSPAHARAGAEAGHRAFLVTHGYNAGDPCEGVERVADWHGVLEALRPDLTVAGLAGPRG